LEGLGGKPRGDGRRGGPLVFLGLRFWCQFKGRGFNCVCAACEWDDRLGSKVCRSEGFHLGLYQGTSYNGLNTLLAFSGTESERE
jgi:hypothetical protein